MNYKMKDTSLIIELDGSITSANSETIGAEIDSIRNANNYTEVILDAKKLTYISSAGLRIILKLAKEAKVKVVNASIEVYEIFEMTGFTSLIEVEKALRNISIENASVVGEGFTATVYRIDKDTIVKVFNDADISDIKRELNLAKRAFVLGIPTAISFDVVMVGDKYGVVFEMLDCDSLRDVINKNKDNLDNLIKDYAKLLKTINSTVEDIGKLPSAYNNFVKKVEYVKDFFTKEEYDQIYQLLGELKDSNTLVHGDCHIKNIMCSNNEFLLIDMDTLSVGNKIFELYAIFASYQAFGEVYENNAMSFLGVEEYISKKLFFDTVHYYFEGESEEAIQSNIEKIRLMCYIHMMFWMMSFESDVERTNYFHGKVHELLGKVNTFNLE